MLVLLLVVGLVPVQVSADATVWSICVDGDSQYVTISPNPAHENDTVTVTPNNGYKITSLEVRPSDGEPLTITENGSARSFTMPGGSVDMLVQVESEDGNGAPHSINLLSAGGGTPSVDKNPAAPGETVTVTPSPDAGNVLDRIQIDYYPATGGNTIYDIPNNGTSFVMPNDIEPGGEVKVTVYYKRDPNAGPVTTPLEVWCYFHPTSGAGTVTAPDTAVPGGTVTFTVLPNEGYKADVTVYNAANTSISIDYTRISQTEYQFTMPEDIPYIFVQFTEGEDDYVPGGSGGNEGGTEGGGGTSEEGVYNISVKENAFATIEVQETSEANEYVDVTITPVAGYRVSNFTVWTLPDYGPVTKSVNGYRFLMPESDVLVAAYVWPLDGTVEYTITNTTDSPNGTATTPAKSAAGAIIPITDTPAEGYEVDTITVVDTEGTPVTVTDKKFVMPDDNVTVNVTFRQIGSGGGNQDGGDQGGTEGGQNIIVEHITEPEQNNSYGAKLDMTDGDILDKFLGDAVATEDTQVWMTVAKLADAPSTEKQAIEAMAASDKLATYLDIKLFKKVGNRDAETISNTRGPVTIAMTLDAGVVPANAESVYIVYYHGGAKTIPASYNHSTRVLTFQASEFSTYALAYKVQAPAATASAGVLDNVPKTGDSSVLSGWTMLVLCCAAMLAAVAVFDKKRAR